MRINIQTSQMNMPTSNAQMQKSKTKRKQIKIKVGNQNTNHFKYMCQNNFLDKIVLGTD